MDTKEFLETLLPEEGVKFVARWFDIPNHPRKGIFMHKPFYDLDEMADNIKWHAAKGNTVYHACSTYKEVKYLTTKTGKEVPAGKRSTELGVQCFNVATAYTAWRAIAPDLTLRSTFIVGYPGETEAEFQHLLDFVREAQIDRAG